LREKHAQGVPQSYLKVTSRLPQGYLAVQDFALRLPQAWGAAEAGYCSIRHGYFSAEAGYCSIRNGYSSAEVGYSHINLNVMVETKHYGQETLDWFS
jgi:hypothetical protein